MFISAFLHAVVSPVSVKTCLVVTIVFQLNPVISRLGCVSVSVCMRACVCVGGGDCLHGMNCVKVICTLCTPTPDIAVYRFSAAGACRGIPD